MIQDDGILTSSYKNFEYFTKDLVRTDSSARDINDISPLATFCLISSSNLEQSSRNYKKLSDVLAKLTGIAHLLMIIFFFIMRQYLGFKLHIFFMNKLYNFDIGNQNQQLETNKTHELELKSSPTNKLPEHKATSVERSVSLPKENTKFLVYY